MTRKVISLEKMDNGLEVALAVCVTAEKARFVWYETGSSGKVP
jgi:hypothetical protein